MQHSKEVSIIFLKNSWWHHSMKFSEKKKIYFLCLSQISRGFKVFTQISRVQGAKINSRLFKVFKEPWELCVLWHISYTFIIWASVASAIETGILKDFVCEMCIFTNIVYVILMSWPLMAIYFLLLNYWLFSVQFSYHI